MPKHQRLALPLVLAIAVIASVLVAAVPSSGGDLAREASLHGGPIFKRQSRNDDNPLQTVVSSLIPTLEQPPS